MRLKENSNNYRASGLKRKDAKHTKLDDRHLPVSGKKDTKKWCGGKVGREHKLKCLAKGWRGVRVVWYALACTECGKELKVWYPGFKNDHKPEWVKDEE